MNATMVGLQCRLSNQGEEKTKKMNIARLLN